MAKKKKNSMALFEVLTGGQQSTRKRSLSVPDWMKRRSDAAEQDASPQRPPPIDDVSADGEQPDRFETVEAVREQSVEAPSAVVAEAADADETDDASAYDVVESRRYEAVDEPDGLETSADRPAISVADGRVTLSLNYVSCAVAGMGLVLLVVLAFMLGRSSVSRPVADEPPGAGARAGLAVGKSPHRRPRAGRPARISGKHYLVIQQFGGRSPGEKADAEAVVAYCEAVRGDLATVMDDGKQYLVLSGKPFDSNRSAEALEYAADVHALGRRYKADENSKYDFNQMDRQGRLDPWFEKEP